MGFFQCNGKNISWNHLSDLYLLDNDTTKTTPGLRLVPKVKYEHTSHFILTHEG